MSRIFVPGDRVLLVDNKRRRHLITLAEGGQFHTHAGIIEHDAIIGRDDGVTVRTTRGARLIAVRPTLSEYVLEMPRGAQVIYPKDLGPILMLADVFSGARILESGVGSGALTNACTRFSTCGISAVASGTKSSEAGSSPVGPMLPISSGAAPTRTTSTKAISASKASQSSVATTDPSSPSERAELISAAISPLVSVPDMLADVFLTGSEPKGGPAQMVQAVAAGEAELGLFLINVLTAPGLDVAGPVPAPINTEIVYFGAPAADAREAAAAKAFIDFLRSDAARKVIAAKGMTPG